MADVKFTRTHEWAEIDGDTVTCGITDYAQKELGDVVFVELPAKGDKVEQFKQMATIESTKAASEIYAPVSGEVIEVNEELVNNPQWVNESPQSRGWMVKIKMSSPAELDNLLTREQYGELVAKENAH